VTSPPSASPPALPAAVVAGLAGAGVVVRTDPALLAGHCVDWTGVWSGPALGMVEPRTTEQVQSVLALARTHGVPVQVQGGNTGLVGGSVPDRPALLLRITGLLALGPVDPVERTVVVGAGVTAAALAAHVRSAGLHLGVDLAARDSATVGGMAATNAGGIAVGAFGMMREQVRGLTAVLADGRIVRSVGRPRKDNAGYDLTGLLVGSEGSLGVITEVEVALHELPGARAVGLVGVADLAEAVTLVGAVRAAGARLLAAEVVDAAGVRRASTTLGVPDPLPVGAQWLLLLEVADGVAGLAALSDRIVAVATDPTDRRRLWAYRERQTELYAALGAGGPEKLDVSLRLDRLDQGVAAIRRVVAEAAAGMAGAPMRPAAPVGTGAARPDVGVFGHALDGNLHVQLLDVPSGTAARVLEEVVRLGGSISAEHGIGRMKAGLLHLVRSADEIAWMRQVKATVDPAGLLNPGVLLPDPQPAPERPRRI
jgi:FAD/FMN-containing dehydrogenase